MSAPVKSAFAAVLVAAALSCGRSENVGWTGRDMPDSVAARATAQPSPAGTLQSEGSPLREEYQQLVRELGPVHMKAMADSELTARWRELAGEIDRQILANSEFHRRLMQRRREIEGIVRQAQSSGQELPAEQRAELGRHYRNIELEMARVRNQMLRTPDYAERYLVLQGMLFDKMRALAPDQTSQIDRMEELETELFRASMTPSPPESTPPPGR